MRFLPARQETRDPQAATRTAVFQGPDTARYPQWSADRAIQWGYLANVVVYRCVEIIANDIASLPVRAGMDPLSPINFNVNAPLARLLGPPPLGPNPEMSGRGLVANAIAKKIVAGRFAWELERRAGPASQVVGIWPLELGLFNPVQADAGRRYWKKYKYGPLRPSGRTLDLRLEDVHYQWKPSLQDAREPMSALQAAGLDISVAVMQDRYDYAFLQNDARPAAIIVHEAFDEKAERDSWRAELEGRHRGYDNAGKLGFLENIDPDKKASEAVFIHQLGLSQRDAETAKRYASKLMNIAIALGVPMSKLDASGRTFSNADAEDRTYWRDTVRPYLLDLQDAINIDLSPRIGREVMWFDTTGVKALQDEPIVIPAQPGLVRLYDLGIINANETRRFVGLDPIDQEWANAYEAAETPEFVPVEVVESDDMDTLSAPAGQAMAAGRRQTPEDARAGTWRATDRVVRGLERLWTRQLRRLFARQSESTLSRLNGNRGRHLLDEARRSMVELAREGRQGELAADTGVVFDVAFWMDETNLLSEELYEGVMDSASASLARTVDIQPDDAFVAAWVRERSSRLSSQITSTTASAITEQLIEGMQLGEGIDVLSRRIRDVFGDASRNRARTIARTEVIGSYNGAANHVASRAPEIAAREWIATVDGTTRPEHAEADGQLAAVGAPFNVGGFAMEYPGDPGAPPDLIINCRCTLGFITLEELELRTRVTTETVSKLVDKLAIRNGTRRRHAHSS